MCRRDRCWSELTIQSANPTPILPAGAKTNGSPDPWRLSVPWCIFFMDLAVVSDLKTEMLLVVERLAGHDGFWADGVRNPSLHWDLV